MKKVLLILIAFALNLGLLAQTKSNQVDVTKGQVHKIIKNEEAYKIVSYDNDGIIIYRASRKGLKKGVVTLEYIDKNLKPTKSNPISLLYNKKKMFIEDFLDIKGKLFLFTSFLNKKTKMNYLFVQSVNKKTLTLNSDIQKVAEIAYEGRSKYNAGDFDILCSDDSSKILISYQFFSEKQASQKIGLWVFDNTMTPLWKKDATIPYPAKLFDIRNFMVNNKGEAFILGLLYNDKPKTTVNDHVNYKYVLLTYSKDNDILKTEISLNDKYLSRLILKNSTNGNIVCSGFFSNTSYGDAAGVCFFTIDGNTKKIMNTHTKKFDTDFILEGLSEKEKEKNKKKLEKGKSIELYHYKTKDLLMRKDGGFVLIAEQDWYESYTTTSSQGYTRTHYTYYNGDILVVSFSADGNIEWNKKVVKFQISSNVPGYYMSYTSAFVNDNLYFLFNDDPKNLKSGTETYYGGRHFILPLVKLDKEGNQSKEILFSDTNLPKVLADYDVSKQITNNELLLYFRYNGKTDMFIKLKFKE